MGVAFVAGQWHDGATRDTTGPQPDARITTLWKPTISSSATR